ncbi:MAG: hypothetical protein ACTSO7_11955 [Candidatus Heimdallarchaeota archaeon]
MPAKDKENNKTIAEQSVPVIKEIITATTNLGKGTIEVPKEIKEIEAMIYSRGKLNAQFFRGNSKNYLLPDWVVKMLSPASEGSVSLGHSSWFINTNYRDWSAFGGLDCYSEGIVTKSGMVVPNIDGYGIISGMQIRGEPYFITRDGKNQQQLLEGYLPVIINNWDIEGAKIKQTVFGGKANKSEIGSLQITKDKEKPNDKIMFTIRPFNQEGVSLIHSITYKPNNKTITINNEEVIKISAKPVRITMANFNGYGDSAVKFNELASQIDGNKNLTIECSVGFANMTFAFAEEITELNVYFKMADQPLSTSLTLEKEIESWEEKLSQALSLKTGIKEIDQLFKTSIVNLLLLVDPDTITPGPTEYHRFWCRDAAFMINALDLLGYHEYAENALTQFIKRQKENGFYYSHEGEFDSNGEGIWALTEHFKFTQDISWLRKNFSSIEKAAQWIITTRKAEKTEAQVGKEELVKGLLPPGFSAEHLGPCDFFYWDNFWGVAGLRDAAFCAEQLNSQKTKNLNQEYESYLTDLLKSLEDAYKIKEYLPVGPYRESDSAMIANLSAYHPTKVLAATNEMMKNTANHIWNHYSYKGGFFHEVAWNCFGTYLTMHLANVFAAQNDQKKVSEIINWLVKNQTCSMGWAEGISPQTYDGGMGDSPHGWASADWIHLLRNLFVRETKDGSIALLSGMPFSWFTNGVKVENLKTHYGEISFSAKIINDVLKINVTNNLSIDTYHIMAPTIITSIRTDKGVAYIEASQSIEVSSKTTKISIGLDL